MPAFLELSCLRKIGASQCTGMHGELATSATSRIHSPSGLHGANRREVEAKTAVSCYARGAPGVLSALKPVLQSRPKCYCPHSEASVRSNDCPELPARAAPDPPGLECEGWVQLGGVRLRAHWDASSVGKCRKETCLSSDSMHSGRWSPI
jgi:hypothetical protein